VQCGVFPTLNGKVVHGENTCGTAGLLEGIDDEELGYMTSCCKAHGIYVDIEIQ
jgi:hypothetical protein